MVYEIDFEQQPGYLLAKVTGENSPETVEAYMADILRKCEEHSCFRVVIHECLQGPRLSATDIYQMFTETSPHWSGRFHQVAYVDEHMGEMAKFAENVGVNRGMPIAVFADLGEAVTWMETAPDPEPA